MGSVAVASVRLPASAVARLFHLVSVDTISPLTDASSSLALAQASSAAASSAAACHTHRVGMWVAA